MLQCPTEAVPVSPCQCRLVPPLGLPLGVGKVHLIWLSWVRDPQAPKSGMSDAVGDHPGGEGGVAAGLADRDPLRCAPSARPLPQGRMSDVRTFSRRQAHCRLRPIHGIGTLRPGRLPRGRSRRSRSATRGGVLEGLASS